MARLGWCQVVLAAAFVRFVCCDSDSGRSNRADTLAKRQVMLSFSQAKKTHPTLSFAACPQFLPLGKILNLSFFLILV